MAEEELTLNLSSLKEVIPFFKKHYLVFLVLLPVLLSAYIRMVPSGMPITDDWAKQSVDSYYKSAIKDQLRHQYPNLPADNLASLIDEQYAQYIQQNKATIDQQIHDTSLQFKQHFQDESGYVYMPDIDPYQWLRYAQNYLDHGYVGDEIRNGMHWDTHMLAPKGIEAGGRPHPIILAYFYKIMKTFNSKITLMQSSNYFPVLLSALSVIPIFFVARMFSGNIGGLFAGIIMAINGAFLGRTSFGHADTDVYNIFFPVYALWFFFLALDAKGIKKKAIYSGLSGLMLGFFGLLWTGWWYVFDFMLAAIGVYVAYLLFFETKSYSWHEIKQNESLKQFLVTSLIFFAATGIFVSLIASPHGFMDAFRAPFEFTKIKQASNVNLWPNVYTTVAELNTASYSEVIASAGGKLFFYVSLIGLLLLFFTKKEGKREYIPYAILSTIWYVGIFYASGKGVRFTMMLVPPFALAVGAAIGITYEKIMAYMRKIEFSPKIASSVIIILLLLAFLPGIRSDINEVKNDIPIVNDAWYNSLHKIKVESQPNAIVNSWWDFGHHFKFLADRGVTFDGASQNTPMAHWIGKVLLTNDETQAIGILRMLDCGSNDAFDTLDKEVKDTSVSVDMLYHIIVLDKSEAQNYLLGKKVSKDTTDKVLSLTHCSPPEDYFITSEDMVSKSAVWAHFGSWNFDRADLWVQGKDLPREELLKRIEKQLNTSEDEAKKIYLKIKSFESAGDEGAANAWIAPWPGYGQSSGCSMQGNDTLQCGGILINLQTKDVQVPTDKGVRHPVSLVYAENNNVIEKKFDGSNLGQSILLTKQGSKYSIMIASPEVAASMFSRLFFYEGAGTSHFEKFSDETDLTGQRIIVWKVKW